jgi:hypothetical protein
MGEHHESFNEYEINERGLRLALQSGRRLWAPWSAMRELRPADQPEARWNGVISKLARSEEDRQMLEYDDDATEPIFEDGQVRIRVSDLLARAEADSDVAHEMAIRLE